MRALWHDPKMPDWGALQTYARQNLLMLSDAPDSMVLGWEAPQAESEPARQAVYVFPMTAYAEPWLVLIAPVCPEACIAARDALLLSSRLTIGSLVLRGSDYALRVTLSTHSLPLADIVLGIERLAWAAVALRDHFMDGKPLVGEAPRSSGTDARVLHTPWTD